MNVRREQLDEYPVDKLVAAEGCSERGIAVGEILGYRCLKCEQGDETLMQIEHLDGCPLDDEFDYEVPEHIPASRSPELEPEHKITVVRAGGRNNPHDRIVLYRCDECGKGDERITEIVHDEACSLAHSNCDECNSVWILRPDRTHAD